ncbi:hypothetical protein WG909_02220 [Peptostreptococcaceae bacterium AGR-M142]
MRSILVEKMKELINRYNLEERTMNRFYKVFEEYIKNYKENDPKYPIFMEDIVEEFDWDQLYPWVRYASVKCFGSPDFDDMNIILDIDMEYDEFPMGRYSMYFDLNGEFIKENLEIR